MTNKYATLQDNYIEEVALEFNKDLKASEKALAKQINKLIGGYFGKDLDLLKRAKLVNEIQQKLNTIILDSNYVSAVNKYIRSFDEINNYQKLLHNNLNGIKLGKIPLNEIRNAQIGLTESNLLGSGVSAKFSEPIKEILTREILVGSNIESARETIENFIIGDEKLGVLQKYAGQVANDTLRQYQGVIEKEVKDKYGMTKTAYLNSLTKDSRGQCRAWVAREILTDEELEQEIPTAIAGGSIDGFSCSGMIPSTNVDNFLSYRGGYNCKHTAVPYYG